MSTFSGVEITLLLLLGASLFLKAFDTLGGSLSTTKGRLQVLAACRKFGGRHTPPLIFFIVKREMIITIFI